MIAIQLHTLVYRIDVQDETNVQEGNFLKNIKRAGPNRRAGRKIFSKSINLQTKIRPCKGDFFPQNTIKPLPIETIKRFPKHTQSISKAFPKTLPKHYQTTPKQGRKARKEVCLIFEDGNTNKRAGWNKRAGGIFSQKQ